MATKYLQHFPKPLLDDLVSGRWLPVVGAGMSLNAQVRPGKSLPLWSDLGARLDEDLRDFASNGPLDSISAFEHEFGRPRLIERLAELLLIREALPGDAHRAFCSIPFDLVCTTNFDFLLERQYDLTPRFVYPVVDEEQLALNVVPDGTLLFKLHGDLRHPSRLVVTEADYDGFISRYPVISTYLANLLITRTAIFIGYSLDDPDFRQVWQIVAQRLGRARRQAYAILVGAKTGDVTRFARRGVTVINLPGTKERYGEILAAVFSEFASHWRDNLFKVSTVTEEEPLRELLLPKSASTRLCFFAVPAHRLPYYRDRIFPDVAALGLVPVTADDVISPGDSVIAKIDALMTRSAIIIVEVGSTWTTMELKLAISKVRDSNQDEERFNQPSRLVIVSFDAIPLPESLAAERHLFDRIVLNEETDTGVNQLLAALRELAPSENQRRSEPQRLLNAREYRAAVISAMTYLENNLRAQLDKPNWNNSRRSVSLHNLITRAANDEIISHDIVPTIQQWMYVRNSAVHSGAEVSRQQAQEIVRGVGELFPYVS